MEARSLEDTAPVVLCLLMQSGQDCYKIFAVSLLLYLDGDTPKLMHSDLQTLSVLDTEYLRSPHNLYPADVKMLGALLS